MKFFTVLDPSGDLDEDRGLPTGLLLEKTQTCAGDTSCSICFSPSRSLRVQVRDQRRCGGRIGVEIGEEIGQVAVEGEEIGGIMAAIFSANDKGEEK